MSDIKTHDKKYNQKNEIEKINKHTDFLTYCMVIDEVNFNRTTIKISEENSWKLKLIAEEKEQLSQAKILNFALDQFFNKYFNEDELKYVNEIKNAINTYESKNINSLISILIGIGRRFKNTEGGYIVKQNLKLTLELARDVFEYEESIDSLNQVQNYFIGNLTKFINQEEKNIKERFENHLEEECIYELITYILKEIEHIEQSKYEFALRNIELAYGEFFGLRMNKQVEGLAKKYINLIKSNTPDIFKENVMLKEKLDILQQPFKQVLSNKEKLDFNNDNELDKIYKYLNVGNFQGARQFIQTCGIDKEYEIYILEKIYLNLNNFLFCY